jgi:hypothetical protein
METPTCDITSQSAAAAALEGNGWMRPESEDKNTYYNRGTMIVIK